MRGEKMKTRLLFVALLAALLLGACGKKDEAAEPTSVPPTAEPEISEERTTILFAVSDLERSMYEDLTEAFEEANPDVHVQLASVNEILGIGPLGGDPPDDLWQRLASQADVISTDLGRDAVDMGLVRDLEPLMGPDPDFQREDFYPGTLERAQWDGGTWYLPARSLYDMIVYDKDAFDEAGVAYPEPGWSWDDFLSAAKALTVREGGEVTRWGFIPPNSLQFELSSIEGRVGPVVDQTSEPPTPRLDQPEVAEAVRWYTDLFLKEEVIPYFDPSDEDENSLVSGEQALVEGGQGVMWNDWSATWALRKQQGNRGIVPYPVDAPESGTTLIVALGPWMSAGTASPDAAWRWMDFLSRQDITRQGPLVRFLPARRSVAESSGFWEDADDELTAALEYAVEHTYVPRITTGYDPFFDAINQILAGDKTVEDALAAAQTQAEADIEEAQTAQAEATPMPPVVVAAPKEPEGAGEDVVNISFSPGVGAFNIQAYRDAAQQFQEAHPDVRVEVEMPDFLGSSPNISGLAEAADCFQWTADVQNPESQAAILNLKPFLDADTSFTTDDFYPSLLDQFTWQGQLWGLPAELQPYVIEFNKDLFDGVGVDYPALDWTTDDFVEVAAALTEGEGDEKMYGFVPQYVEIVDLLPFLERRGARLIDKSADPPEFTFDDPATVEALRWYVELSSEYEVKPVLLADIADAVDANAYLIEREALINNGRAAMWTGEIVSLLGDRQDLNTGVAPLPIGVDGTSGGGSAFGYYISADTEARQACWQFITFLTEQPGLTQGLPSRRSVAESDAYDQQVGAEQAAVYRASAEGAQASTGDVFEGETWMSTAGSIWLGRAFDQVVNEGASVEEALNSAQKMAEDFRACVIVNDAMSDQDEWQACIKEVDPTVPDFLLSQGE
jgi:ABC-type glycerol-3-phosphate transport system substrate-binding protein